jgi:hypothetical protein
MAQTPPTEKLVTPVSLIVDAILCLGFFAFLFSVLRSHVPSNEASMIALWAGLGSACMTGVLWLALQMFRVVFRAQRQSKR